jgi:type IV pilus assembly protein PilP
MARVRSLLALLVFGSPLLFPAAPSPGAQKEGAEESKPAKYVYDPTGKTDPFKSFIAEQEPVAAQKERNPRTYLETLDLSQLELIAIVVGPKGNYAMVRDSKGVGHVIQKGTPIGTNDGTVHAVTEREVIVREEYKDFRGAIQYREVAKRLPTLQ